MMQTPLNISNDFVGQLQRLDFKMLVDFFITLLRLYRPSSQSTLSNDAWREALQQLSTFAEQELRQLPPEKSVEVDQTWLDYIDNIEQYAIDLGPEDLSINHEYYLYGGPKRQ